MPGSRVAFAALICAIGCRAGDAPPAGRTVADSAGIEIVTLQVAADTKVSAPAPLVDIGLAEGEAAYELSEVIGVVRLRDDRIVVGNAGTDELRFFDANGRFLHASGRSGEGPGEFGSLAYLARLAGDTILTYDAQLRRFSLFDDTGRYLRSRRLTDAILPYVAGLVSPHVVALWHYVGEDDDRLGVYPVAIEFGIVPLDAGAYRLLGSGIGATESRVQYEGRVIRAFQPFAPEGDVAVTDGRIYVLSAADTRSIRVYDADGTLQRIIHVETARQAPDAASLEVFVESWMDRFSIGMAELDARWRHGFRETPPPELIPVFRSLETDAAGNVCAERYPMSWNGASVYWCISPDGHLLRRIHLPPGLERLGPHPHFDPQLEIGADRALGIWDDSLGVQHVRIYPVPGPDASRLGWPSRSFRWYEHQLYGRYDIVLDSTRRIVWNPSLFYHAGHGQNGQTTGRVIALVQGVGLALERSRMTVIPSASLALARGRRTFYGDPPDRFTAVFLVLAMNVTFHGR